MEIFTSKFPSKTYTAKFPKRSFTSKFEKRKFGNIGPAVVVGTWRWGDEDKILSEITTTFGEED